MPRVDAGRESGWLGRLVWHPAFAYALVVALLVPLVRGQLEHLSGPARLAESERASEMKPEVAPGGGTGEDQPATVGAVAPAARPAAPPVAERVAPAAPVPPAEEGRARQMAAARSERRESESDRTDLAMRKLASPDTAGGKEQAAEEKAETARENVPAGAALADRVTEPSIARYRRGEGPLATPAAGAPRPPAQSALIPSFEIRAGIPVTIPLMVAERGPLLYVMTPDFGEGPLDVDVHVRAIAGTRELTRRISSRANTIALQIPPHWLTAGDYTITVAPVAPPRAADAEFAAAAPITMGFAVRAPGADDVAR
jgi:hypothetical protein